MLGACLAIPCQMLQSLAISAHFPRLPNSTVQHSGDLTYNKDGDPRSTG